MCWGAYCSVPPGTAAEVNHVQLGALCVEDLSSTKRISRYFAVPVAA